MKTPVRTIAAVVLLVGLVTATSSSAQVSNVTVSVVGQGPSIGEAKQDAIRQALQLTMKQLVVVDRLVSGNTLLRNKILSTMNGYVERYVETNVSSTPNGFRVAATITISSSRIENFIGVPTVVGGAVQGGTLFDEVNKRNAQITAERLQAQARTEIFDRLMRGFPTRDSNIKLVNITIDGQNPNVLDVTLDYSFKPEFRRALDSTVRALAWFDCPHVGAGRGMYGATIWSAGIHLGSYAHEQAASCSGPGISAIGQERIKSMDHNFVDLFCLAESGSADCYGLKPGDYCAQCQIKPFDSGAFYENMPVVFGRFVDDGGNSANIGTNCIVALAYSGNSVVAGAVKSKWHFTGGVDFTPSRFMIKVPVAQVDLRRAKGFVAVAGLLPGTTNNWFWKSQYEEWRPGSGRWITDVLPDQPNATNGCQLLDQAVRYTAIEKR